MSVSEMAGEGGKGRSPVSGSYKEGYFLLHAPSPAAILTDCVDLSHAG